MANDERAGWELIWRGEQIPPRYSTLAAPNPAVVEWVDTLPTGGYVLDVGSGVGRHVVYLGERGFHVAGVDIAPSGIGMTEAVCAERGITFDGYVGDMTELPWADNLFDGALSTSTMHHHLRADIIRALDEVWRVLKPGGGFVVDFPSIDTLAYQRVRTELAAGEITEVEPNTFIDERPDLDDQNDAFLPHHFCDEADVRDLLRRFEIVKLWREQAGGKVGKWVASVRKPPVVAQT